MAVVGLSDTDAGLVTNGVISINSGEWLTAVYDGSLIPLNSILLYDYGIDNTAKSEGMHTGADAAATLTDANRPGGWTTNQWNGYDIKNLKGGGSGSVTANDSTTITATLTGGTADWDTDDDYILEHPTLLADSSKSWETNQWANFTLYNETDGCTGLISSNTATTLTVASLTGGFKNSFRVGNVYKILMNISVNDKIQYWSTTPQGGTVSSMTVKGVPTITGPNDNHTITCRIVDVDDGDSLSAEFTVTVSV